MESAAESPVELPYEIAHASPAVREHYLRMIAAGQTPRFAEMCALQQAPALQGTDDQWNRGRNNAEWLDQLPTKQAKRILREAKAAGISTEGKFYMSGLSTKAGHLDPEAWVSSRADVLRVAEKRKLEVKGQISYTPPEGVAPPQRRNAMNPKLVRELARKEMRAEPGLTLAKASERVREKHSLSGWKKS